MKKITLIPSALLLSAMFAFSGCSATEPAAPAASVKEAAGALVPMEKMGFLTTSGCAAAGAFQDCHLENYMCGSEGCYETTPAGVTQNVQVVIYSHNDGHVYNLDLTNVNMANVDSSINRNEVTIVGNYNEATNTIIATEVKAPPPPKKSFFKGCL